VWWELGKTYKLQCCLGLVREEIQLQSSREWKAHFDFSGQEKLVSDFLFFLGH